LATSGRGEAVRMELSKDFIVKELEKQGHSEKAQKLLQELPDKVDHEEHAALLKQHGVDPGELAAKAAQQGLAML
jgi:hypothetical protein